MSRISSALLLCIIIFSSLAEAQTASRWSSGIDFTKRAANREKGRWSLSDWLAMKERNRMMDQWLSINSPSPFEFSLGGTYNSFKTQVDSGEETSHISYKSEASAYAQFVGVTAEYENNSEEDFNDLAGMLNVRVLGNSIQNTAFTLHFGQRTRTGGGETLRQEFGQASLQLYLTKYFGVDGRYRYFLPKTSDTEDLKEDQTEAGLFIDFKALRIYGSYFKDTQRTKSPSASDENITERTGIRTGLKIFF